MRAWLRQRYLRWLAARLPRANHFALHQGNLFIFLNRHALFYLGVSTLLWIGASNFENNLIYSLCFFMLALLVAGIILTFNNLSKLQIDILPPQPVFAGEAIQLPLQLHSQKLREHIQLQFDEMPAVLLAADVGVTSANTVAPPMPRGRQLLPRLGLASVYPLGIIRCWSYLYPAQPVWVYPAPMPCDLQSCNAGSGRLVGSAAQQGSDEFHSLKAYRAGDSLVRIAWKQYAAGRGLLVSEYEANQHSGDWQLDYDLLTDTDPEIRLSKLCYAVLELSKMEQVFSLKLPQQTVAAGSGSLHETLALQALASVGARDV